MFSRQSPSLSALRSGKGTHNTADAGGTVPCHLQCHPAEDNTEADLWPEPTPRAATAGLQWEGGVCGPTAPGGSLPAHGQLRRKLAPGKEERQPILLQEAALHHSSQGRL